MTIEERVAALLGTPKETEAKLVARWPHFAGRPDCRVLPTLTIKGNVRDVETGMLVKVHLPGLTTIVQFYVQRYPACCGAVLFHHFMVHGDFDMPEFDNIMYEVLESLWTDPERDMYLNNKRFIAVFVEGGRSQELIRQHKLRDDDDDGAMSKLRLLEVGSEKPQVHYQKLWDFFHNKAARVTDRPFYNINSGNVCHEIEAVFE